MGRTYNYDLIIIGAGAAGIMAALSARSQNDKASITIIEGSFAPGRKLLVSGGGRCNLYNEFLAFNPEDHYYDTDKKLLRSIFNQFGYEQIKTFFQELGIKTYVETKANSGKVFPITDQARNVVDLLTASLEAMNIKVELNSKVSNISREDKFKLQVEKEGQNDTYICDKLVLAAGGKTYPALGSDGSGFDLARRLGHDLIRPIVAAVPLCSKDPIAQQLQGCKMQAGLKISYNGKFIRSAQGDLLFTKYGVSGTAILNISRDASKLLNREGIAEIDLEIDLTQLAKEQLHRYLLGVSRKNPEIKLPIMLNGLIHYKAAMYFCKRLGITALKYLDLEEMKQRKLLEYLTSYKMKINETRGWNEAEFTSGGIDTNEVEHKSLESKLCNGLYLCGEILDVDGEVGGYNLSWAWASGAVAGRNAAVLN